MQKLTNNSNKSLILIIATKNLHSLYFNAKKTIFNYFECILT